MLVKAFILPTLQIMCVCTEESQTTVTIFYYYFLHFQQVHAFLKIKQHKLNSLQLLCLFLWI